MWAVAFLPMFSLLVGGRNIVTFIRLYSSRVYICPARVVCEFEVLLGLVGR